MKVFFDAIKALYDGSGGATLRASNTGGLWRERVPQKHSYPFIVMHHISGGHMDTFKENLETMTIQFNAYDDSSNDDKIDTIGTALMSLFDWCTLSITGYSAIVCERVFNQSFHNDEEDVWQYVIQYRIIAQKS